MHPLVNLLKTILADALIYCEKGASTLADFPADVLMKDETDPLFAAFRGVQEAAKVMDKALAEMRRVAADKSRTRVPAPGEATLADVQAAISRIGGVQS